MNRHESACPPAMPIRRRDFLKLSAGAGAAAALSGCATNAVTGRRQLMLMTEEQEQGIDKQYAPHQFSSDYGAAQDPALNDYVNRVGQDMAKHTHRPHMPYSFVVLNSPFYNAYTFPGGTCGVLRGLLLDMDNEAQLAAVLGHEMGHVNYRHSAERYSKQILAGLLVAGVTAYVAIEHEEYTELAAGLGAISAGALLAKYSRQNEREADAIGVEYAVRAGQNPEGMVEFMDHLRRADKHKPNLVQVMFASHPMSEERYQTAKATVRGRYSQATGRPRNRERFMDMTARIRRSKDAVELIQQGTEYQMKKKYDRAHSSFQAALKKAPNDYAGLLLMANCCLALKKPDEARRYAKKAKSVYPAEPQSYHALGMISLRSKDYDAAHENFAHYKKALPGNADTLFFNGFALENMGRKEPAAEEYKAFLQQGGGGDNAKHARQRLVQWGHMPAS